MSDYTKVQFYIQDTFGFNQVDELIKSLWDAYDLNSDVYPGAKYASYNLTISELDLTNSMSILETIRDVFGARITVLYGVL